MPKTVLAFGEVLWDLLPDRRILGGAPFNFAYRVNCLGETGIMASRLGTDELGRQAMQKMQALGMDTSHIQWDRDHPTGTVKVSFDDDNNPDYVIIPHVAYDFTEATDDLQAVAGLADCLCFGTLAQREPAARQALAKLVECAPQAVKLLDINFRKKCYTVETVTDSLEKADILKLNEDEAGQLGKMLAMDADRIDVIAQGLVDRYKLACCVVTLAARGALIVSADGGKTYSPGYKVELVDSLGSGDAFTAGFITKYLNGATAAECVEYGNVLGAIVATQKGATAPITRDDVSSFLAAGPERLVGPTMAQYACQ